MSAFAQDIAKAIDSRESLYGKIYASYKGLSSLQHLKYDSSLSSIDLSYSEVWQREYGLYHEGLGIRLGRFSASTYLKGLNALSIWGNASYSKGKEKKVKWNSTLDFDRLYPYIVADSLGGDFTVEKYVFSGGLSKAFIWGSLGAQVAYRATQGFRTVDPRPRDIVSDFEISLSYAKNIGEKYTLGGEISYDRYSQVANVENYNEVKQSPEWLMSGLGTEFRRITLGKSELIYTGHEAQIELSLVPNIHRGLYANFIYGYGAIQRLVSELNVAPINGYGKHRIFSKVGYLTNVGKLTCGINTKLNYEQRIGYDNVLGNAGAGEYDVIAKLELFEANRLTSMIEFPIGYEQNQGFSWRIVPEVSYGQLHLRNIYPDHLFKTSNITPSLLGMIKWQKGKSAVLFEINGLYEVNLYNQSRVLKGALSTYLVNYLDHTLEYLSHNKLQASIGLEYRHIISDKYSVGFHSQYTYKNVLRANPHALTMTISFNY
ncbi:DUF6850 family outer membrane beta-barrel protein [Porphyromonas sp.]|uniref:DUF6850 family outer membrane beta-barrel protein n=1 Tax=Porphyromonas sp. TaxID=1924944 RepID=UPI0026DC5835|nr:DUF6850 family outer membrane beta-barrel protein [Porphyromonas sp.]MDO4771504.1 hypothetical protein [Porphyromonas sp.]